MRLGQGNQVPYGPCDHVAVSLQVAFAPLIGAEYAGNITRDRRLFGENRDCTGFICLHLDSQSTPIANERAGAVPGTLVLFDWNMRNVLIQLWTFPSLR